MTTGTYRDEVPAIPEKSNSTSLRCDATSFELSRMTELMPVDEHSDGIIRTAAGECFAVDPLA